MLKITLTGAGGKMGLRLTDNFIRSKYNISYLEVNSVGIQKLKEKGVTVSRQKDCIPGAAKDFLLGHLHIQMAVSFDELPGAVFSDAANKALERGLRVFIKDDWKKIFEPENVIEQIKAIT